jgi:hypothetical protein
MKGSQIAPVGTHKVEDIKLEKLVGTESIADFLGCPHTGQEYSAKDKELDKIIVRKYQEYSTKAKELDEWLAKKGRAAAKS